MKTLLISLAVFVIVAFTAHKQDTAEALFHAWMFGCLTAFAVLCTWITAKLRHNRLKRIRENNRFRKESITERVVVLQSLAEEMEVVGN